MATAVMLDAIFVPPMLSVVSGAGYCADCTADGSTLCCSVTAAYNCAYQGAGCSALNSFSQNPASLGIADRDNDECG